jgi:DNA-directed RNA polymerase subunit F
LKRFIKIEPAQAKKLKKELQEELPNLSPVNIAKIIDISPCDAEDARKIFVDTSVDENEITKILEIVKKYL